MKLQTVVDFRPIPCLGPMREGMYQYFLDLAQTRAIEHGIDFFKLYLVTYTHPSVNDKIIEATETNWNKEAESTSYMHTPIVYVVDVSKYQVVTT